MPHKDRVDGTVRSTKPLSYGGNADRRLQPALRWTDASSSVQAERGEIGAAHGSSTMDRGRGAARRAGAGAAQFADRRRPGVLFYNTLFDENAASHVALGAAYKFTLRGGESDERRGVRSARAATAARPTSTS